MRIIQILITLSLLAALSFAQPNSYGFVVTHTTANDYTNNTASFGICGEITHDLMKTDLVTLHADGCYNNGKKAYVGDGHNLGASGEAHVYFQHKPAELRLYLIAGVGWAEQFNSQYRKGIINPYIGAGLNYRSRWFVEGKYLLPEHGTANAVSAIKVGSYYIHPIADHWSAKVGGSFLSTKFTQPNGAGAGTYRALTSTVYGGLLRMDNKKPVSGLQSPMPMAIPRIVYADLPVKAMGYFSDFGNYRLIIPAL